MTATAEALRQPDQEAMRSAEFRVLPLDVADSEASARRVQLARKQ